MIAERESLIERVKDNLRRSFLKDLFIYLRESEVGGTHTRAQREGAEGGERVPSRRHA